jgi:hypothetical protein
VLGFLAFAVILLLLTVAIPFCLFKVLGWGLARRPFVTLLAAFLTVLVLIAGFPRIFAGCKVIGIGWGRVPVAVRCTR